MDRTSVISPNTGQQIARWRADAPSVTENTLQTLHKARRKLEGNIELRIELLDELVAAMHQSRNELERLTVEEVGKKPEEASGEFEYALSFITYCRDLARNYSFETATDDGRLVREIAPGVAFLITPFNDPIAGITRKIAPALAAGAPVLVKPASLGMMCAQAMRDAFAKTETNGFVKFACLEDPAIAEALIADPRIGVVSFTGSSSVGNNVAVAAAKNNKRAVLELGGNAPFVVLADADLEKAVDDLVIRKLKAAGQACSSVNRVFVERSIYGRFRDILISRAEQTTLGRSTSGVDLGPVRTLRAARQLESWSNQALQAGERLLAGSAGAASEGEPILFPFHVIEAEQTSLFDEIETFGPLLSFRAFDSLDDLLATLEAEPHALVAYFYSADAHSLRPKLQHLRFGSIGINTTAIQGPEAPTGGFGEAGVGREGGAWGFREFLSTVNIR